MYNSSSMSRTKPKWRLYFLAYSLKALNLFSTLALHREKMPGCCCKEIWDHSKHEQHQRKMSGECTMHAVKVCGQEWKKSCSTTVKTSRRTTLWKSWRLWSGDIMWVTGPTEESAPPTVGCLRQPEESSTMIISFSLHNSCSNKMCQVILTKPKFIILL